VTELIPRDSAAAWRVLLMPVESQLPHLADSPCGTDELDRITLVCEANMKTRFPQISVALSLLLSVSYLAAAPKVVSDYDLNANFSAYKTFMWIKTPHMPDPLMPLSSICLIQTQSSSYGAAGPPMLSPMIRRRKQRN
jgi:hypothetical protein